MTHCEGKNKKELLEIIQIMRDDHEEEINEWVKDTLLLKAEIAELEGVAVELGCKI